MRNLNLTILPICWIMTAHTQNSIDLNCTTLVAIQKNKILGIVHMMMWGSWRMYVVFWKRWFQLSTQFTEGNPKQSGDNKEQKLHDYFSYSRNLSRLGLVLQYKNFGSNPNFRRLAHLGWRKFVWKGLKTLEHFLLSILSESRVGIF